MDHEDKYIRHCEDKISILSPNLEGNGLKTVAFGLLAIAHSIKELSVTIKQLVKEEQERKQQ